jgi:hypothetical protein
MGPIRGWHPALKVTAKDIQVREGAGPEPFAKANTVPRPRPSNPSPSAEVAEQPSNAGPDLPSADN